MISHGHELFRLLQDGKYFAARRGAVEYDYWEELPPERRRQYENTATLMMKRGIDLAAEKEFDPEAVTIVPPPLGQERK